MRVLLPLALAALLLAGCEHAEALGPDPGPGDGEPATLRRVQEEVFSRSCALSGCHAGSSAPLGLDLSAGQAHGNTVGVRSVERPDLFRVAPGDPDASYLIKKVQGDADIVGGRMPLGSEPLSDDEIQLLRDWVTAGAPEE